MLAEVRVVSGARSAQMRAAPARYRLRFPRHWRAQPVSNPAEAAIEEGTLAWLATHGMGIEAADREKLRKFECGKYGGYSMPRAALPEALLITEYISLWLFWDDVEVEEHAGWSVDDVVRVLTTRGPPSESRYVNAWGELGARLGERRGAGWLTRLGLSMRNGSRTLGVRRGWRGCCARRGSGRPPTSCSLAGP